MKIAKETDSAKSIKLLNSVTSTARVSTTVAGYAVSAVSAAIAESLRSGKNVSLGGIGTFSLKTRAIRAGESPRRDDGVRYPTLKLPTFRGAQALRLGENMEKGYVSPIFALRVGGNDATTRLHLVRQVANAANVSEEEAARALDGVIAVSQQALKSGRAVSFPGVGTLSVDVGVRKRRRASTGTYVMHGGHSGSRQRTVLTRRGVSAHARSVL